MAGDWIDSLARDASRRFDEVDWPSPDSEDWRRTGVAGLDFGSFLGERADAEATRAAAVPELAAAIPELAAPLEPSMAGHLRFRSGRFAGGALCGDWGSRGLRFAPLGRSDESAAPVAELLRSALEGAGDRISLLHFARLGEGAFLVVPPGLEVEEPFLVEFEEPGEGSVAAPQLAVVLGEGARATVLLRASGPGRLLWTGRTDVALGPGSSLRLFEAQGSGPEALRFHGFGARLGSGASLERVSVELGGKVARTRLDCALEGRGAEANLSGAYYCGAGQRADLGTSLRHLSPGATSRTTYKGAEASGGSAVYQGLIEVAEGAKGTDAYLSNRNLLLGETARADSIPTLKIGNDDVRCSHGSATGRLGEEELFYLASRGLSEPEARELLVLGYFEELLAKAPESFRDAALAGIRELLPRAA